MEMIVVSDVAELAQAARQKTLEALGDAVRARGRASLALSGGSTPRVLYQAFSSSKDPFDAVDFYFGDERAVPPDHPSSNYRMARDAWLSSIPEDRVHRMRGEAADLDGEALRYEKELPEKLDVVLLGMGDDGHTASIFPNTPPTTEKTRRVLALHAGAPEFKRLTITPPEIRNARKLVVLVAGKSKADRLKEVMYGPVDVVKLPVQLALREHPDCLLVVDKEAAIALRNMRA